MPDLKISQLPPASTPLAGTELVPIVQGGVTEQTTVQAILTGTVPSGTANGVLYLNGSKVVSSGSGLTFNGGNTLTLDGGSAGYFVGPTGEMLIGEDASGLYVGGGAGGLPSIPIFFGSNATTYQLFKAGGSEQMRLTSTGLGIGTNNPTAKLEVLGAVNSEYARMGGGDTPTRSLRFSTFVVSGANNTGHLIDAPGASGLYGTLAFATNSTERMRLDSSGNLGLGTVPGAYAAAARVLDFTYPNFGMDANGSGFMSFNARNSTGSTWVYKTDDNASRFEANLDGSFRWYTAGAAPGTAGNAISFSQAMTLDASGNLLVGGTSVYAATVTSYGSASRSGGIGIRNSAGTAAGAICTYSAGSGSGSTDIIVESAGILYLNAGGTERARIPAAGGMVVGTAALATNATDGFLYVPTCAGTPTGTPTTQTGTAPIVINTTNNKLYFYSGGAWRDAGP